ncbi:MAG: hypothetical protein JW801_18155 [Bacteroidales bacterium]|nr:hypothetical protein [Bacteroidales bacterium]
MKKLFLCLIVTCTCAFLSNAQDRSIEDALYELPDVIFKEIQNSGDFEKSFELKIKQPLDHEHPGKGYFYQRVFLSHKDFNKPTVMYISGYSQGGVYVSEPTKLLGANQLSIEHRYFGKSLPDSMDWTCLTIEQASADLHHINELFRKIYTGKWVSTGISKGGATTIFYKYFYPGDVDAGIPYVAPVNHEFEEQSLYTFLDTVGTDECRAKILAFQKRIFRQREEVVPLIELYSQGAELEYKYLGLEQAFEYCVLEYPFAFWQWGTSCDDIPVDTSSLVSAVKHLVKVCDIKLFSDEDIDYYLPHYYQSASQLGYYGYRTEDFIGDLKVLPLEPHPHAALIPEGIPVSWDGSILEKVHKWARKDGDKLIYIYGQTDTWSGSAIPPSDKVDAVWFFMKDKDHRTARYQEMTPKEQALFISTLERWLTITIGKE